jgi:hypothetical protein
MFLCIKTQPNGENLIVRHEFDEERDGPAVNSLGKRSRKLSNIGHRMRDQKFTISSYSVLRKAR